MMRLFGVLSVLAGAGGFGFRLCAERRERICCMMEIREMYGLIQSEIAYTALPLPEIFRNISGKIPGKLGETLEKISEGMALEQGEVFAELWTKEMTEYLRGKQLGQDSRRLLLDFPACTGRNDSRGQADAINRYLDELDRSISQMKEEEKSKNKVVISLGIAAGLLTVLLLL
jgi:stage III sporulation protein AB